jgi:hypothetical protein
MHVFDCHPSIVLTYVLLEVAAVQEKQYPTKIRRKLHFSTVISLLKPYHLPLFFVFPLYS